VFAEFTIEGTVRVEPLNCAEVRDAPPKKSPVVSSTFVGIRRLRDAAGTTVEDPADRAREIAEASADGVPRAPVNDVRTIVNAFQGRGAVSR